MMPLFSTNRLCSVPILCDIQSAVHLIIHGVTSLDIVCLMIGYIPDVEVGFPSSNIGFGSSKTGLEPATENTASSFRCYHCL